MRFPFIVLLLLMFVGTSFAQNDYSMTNNTDSTSVQSEKINRSDNQWYIGSSKVEENDIVSLLKSNPESASDYSTAMVFYYPGLVFAGVGGFYGLVSWILDNSAKGMYLTLGGATSIGIRLLLCNISYNYIESSIKIYNMSIDNKTSLKLKNLPTEQGGLALALAF